MLNGIEVLDKVELMDIVYNPIVSNISLALASIIIICLLVSFLLAMLDNMGFMLPLGLGILLLVLFVPSILIKEATSKQVPNGKYQYQVTISDNVSMVEFNERYDVISVEGKIYTIVEKESK